MTTTGVLLGGEENDTRAQMLDVIQFETELANVSYIGVPPYTHSMYVCNVGSSKVANNMAFRHF